MATIQVAMRCRPFTIEDKLGVQLLQNSDDPPTSECNLLNSQYDGDRARFGFSYCWWSAFNYKLKLKGDDLTVADSMKMMSQPAVYEAVGHRIKADLMNGNAVVMFAYGLSGSGKTFTVFGPDATDSPDAWFKHSEPHKLWGILPNMAYELFKEKKEDWKISMKYFQNVVDIVRDLMSPQAKEQHYKQGMSKDEDGFMDIQWCSSKVLHSWDDFRNAFMAANGRKAISPTQFNHQSTRGHCIMTLEVEKPTEDDPGRKQRGRLYVCDLAGTEPAGDIFYAQYKCETDAEGNKEYSCLGPHPDQSKTKELQDQGKKINLSLSEMAQFFMKMAEAVVKNQLKPGATIPGCNSFFLCKYLKDTLLQAKTYLFCAIRPEVTYHRYTFATLGFAKNASVIKVQPKKATSAMTPQERKLMEELEANKALVEQLKLQNKELQNSVGGAGHDDDAAVAKLSQKDKELQEAVAAASAAVAELQKMQEQSSGKAHAESDEELRQRWARHGIKLAELDGETQQPHFQNLDIDSFRNGRFLFVLERPQMTFGPKGDFRPQSLAVVPDHCTVTLSEPGEVAVRAGQGRTFVNGRLLAPGETARLAAFDRLAVGSELLMLRLPGMETEGGGAMSAEDAATEYQEALVAAQKAQGPGGSDAAVEVAKQALQASSVAATEGNASGEKKGLSEAAMARIDAQLAELHPKLAQAAQMCLLIDPSNCLEFQLTLRQAGITSHGHVEDAEVGVNVTSPSTSQSIALSAAEFNTCFLLLSDELGHMRDAVTYGGEHTISSENRPVVRFFDHMIHLGTCVQFTEILQYNMDTAPEDRNAKILKVAGDVSGQVEAGKLYTAWTPLAGPDDDGSGTVPEMDEPTAFLGKPWTYKFEIREASGLPINVVETYVEYTFFGERCTTEVKEYQKGARSPNYEYSFVHHIGSVTQEFLDFIKQPLELKIFITPYVFVPPQGISASDPAVAARLRDPQAPVAAAEGGRAGPEEAPARALAVGAAASGRPEAEAEAAAALAALEAARAQAATAEEEATQLRAELAKLREERATAALAEAPGREAAQEELRVQLDQAQREAKDLADKVHSLETEKRKFMVLFPGNENVTPEEVQRHLEEAGKSQKGSATCSLQ